MNYTLRSAEQKKPHHMFGPMPMQSTMVDEGIQNYQEVEFYSDSLPEIKDWQVGSEYTLIIKVRETAHKTKEEIGEGDKEEAHFDILQVGAFNDAPDMQLRSKVLEKIK